MMNDPALWWDKLNPNQALLELMMFGACIALAFLLVMALRRVVTNLVDNALRHGSPPVTVTVTDEKDAVLIDVSDRGPGIPAEDHERVLQPFMRLEPSRNRETGGTGLGLTIARTIVHAHGGSMTLINLRPRGLQVRLLMPKAIQEPAAPTKEGTAGP
jgi:signal transduction histidine kinase